MHDRSPSSHPPLLMVDRSAKLARSPSDCSFGGVLDLLHLRIPLRPEHVPAWRGYLTSRSAIHNKVRGLFDVSVLPCRLVGNIETGLDGEQIVTGLRTTFEKLDSSHSGIAFRVYDGKDGIHYPCVELKFSPAKCLQGHNLYGPDCISLGAKIGLVTFSVSRPTIYDMCEIESTEVVQLDYTYSVRLPSHNVGLQVIAYLKNLSKGQCSSRGDGWDTTAYFYSKDSRELGLKFYLKYIEFLSELKAIRKAAESGSAVDQRRLAVMSDPKLINFAENLLRIESTVKKRWLEDRGYSTLLIDMINLQRGYRNHGWCILTEWWRRVTKPVFESFAGCSVRVLDDEKILERLKQWHFRILPNGQKSFAHAKNLFKTYREIRDLGWNAAKDSMATRTFFRHVKEIEIIGISRAQLQNLKTDAIKNNVVPLLRFVDVDVSATAQRPEWYTEPKIDLDIIAASRVA